MNPTHARTLLALCLLPAMPAAAVAAPSSAGPATAAPVVAWETDVLLRGWAPARAQVGYVAPATGIAPQWRGRVVLPAEAQRPWSVTLEALDDGPGRIGFECARAGADGEATELPILGALLPALTVDVAQQEGGVARVALWLGFRQRWEIDGSRREGWSTFGSFCDLELCTLDDIEHPAARRAERKLRRVAPKLARRIFFDQGSDGTGIYARRRADLVRTLKILGLRPPAPLQRLA